MFDIICCICICYVLFIYVTCYDTYLLIWKASEYHKRKRKKELISWHPCYNFVRQKKVNFSVSDHLDFKILIHSRNLKLVETTA